MEGMVLYGAVALKNHLEAHPHIVPSIRGNGSQRTLPYQLSNLSLILLETHGD